MDDFLLTYIAPEVLTGLNRYKGEDRSADFTIRQLLAQSSGIPDYFEGKPTGGKSLQDRLLAGEDHSWDLSNVLRMSCALDAKFKPGAKKKAHYSDTNFQLLGHLIETVEGRPYDSVLHRKILQPLGLEYTYLYSDPSDRRPVPLLYKERELHIPKAMCSFGPDGGIVSNASESMTFLKAFFEGRLFAADRLPLLNQWRNIMFPLEYGVGLMRFRVPLIFMPIGGRPEYIGHSGLSGAFSFYIPDKELYLTGTLNQISRPDLLFRLLIDMAAAFK